jgi:hypothetical protein
MTKYQQLTDQLLTLAAAGQQIVEFDFANIAELVGGLPPSALEHRTWWANDSKVQAGAWRAADWHVDTVSLDRHRVRFARGQVGGSHRQAVDAQRQATMAVSGVETNHNGAQLDLHIWLTWQPVGAVILTVDSRLQFAEAPGTAGIYRITWWGRRGQRCPQVYIGEADNLRRR